MNPNSKFFLIWSPSVPGLSHEDLQEECLKKNRLFYRKFQQFRSNVWSSSKIIRISSMKQRSFASQPWYEYWVNRSDGSDCKISDADFPDLNPNDLISLLRGLRKQKLQRAKNEKAILRIYGFLEAYLYDIFSHDKEVGEKFTGDAAVVQPPDTDVPTALSKHVGATLTPELGVVFRDATKVRRFVRARQIYRFDDDFLELLITSINSKKRGPEEAIAKFTERVNWWMAVRRWGESAFRRLQAED